MNHFLIIAASAVICAGCSSGTHALKYLPAGSADSTWSIKTERNDVTGDMEIKINESTVCASSMGLFRLGKRMSGMYRGHTVTAMLQDDKSYMADENTTCIVIIDRDTVGHLEW
ncbi:MAG TPA: hypothetical protein VES59_01725 [Bacteroidota bacterium]|nr:hypothetical protein [Bacteroidota bacterium]